MKLAEHHAREREIREKRQREQREREAQEQQALAATKSNLIQVKPIIETTNTLTHPTRSSKSYVRLSNGDHDVNTTDDLLRLIN